MTFLRNHPNLSKFVFTKLVPTALYGGAFLVPSVLGAIVLTKLGFEPKLAIQVSGAIVLMYIAFTGMLNMAMSYIVRKHLTQE